MKKSYKTLIMLILAILLFTSQIFAGVTNMEKKTKSQGKVIDTSNQVITETGYGHIIDGRFIFDPQNYYWIFGRINPHLKTTSAPTGNLKLETTVETYEYAIQGNANRGKRIEDLRVRQEEGNFTKADLINSGLLKKVETQTVVIKEEIEEKHIDIGSPSNRVPVGGTPVFRDKALEMGLTTKDLVGLYTEPSNNYGQIFFQRDSTCYQEIGREYKETGDDGVWMFEATRYNLSVGDYVLILESRGTGEEGKGYFNVKLQSKDIPPVITELRSDPLWFEQEKLMGEVKSGEFYIKLGKGYILHLSINKLTTKTNFTSGDFITRVEVIKGNKKDSFVPEIGKGKFYANVKEIIQQKKITEQEFYRFYVSDISEWNSWRVPQEWREKFSCPSPGESVGKTW